MKKECQSDPPKPRERPQRRGDSRALVAFVALGAVFVLGGFLMPWWYIAVSVTAAGVVGGVLLTAPHWPTSVSRLLKRRIPVYRWAALGALAGIVSLVALTGVRPVTVTSAAWTVLLCLSCAGVAGALAPPLLGGVSRYPVWQLVTTASAIIGIGITVRELHWEATLFLAVLVALALYLWVVVPLALLQRRREDQTSVTSPAPRVSVLIPAYNESGYIDKCIRSVLASSYPADRLEIVVIDDGSEDSTATDAKRYRDRGVIVLQRKNGGKHAAINFGLLCSTGEYVVVVDADSRVAPDAIPTLIARMQSEPELGGIGGTVRVANDAPLARVQALEYAFAINSIRRAYSLFGVVPVLPGCLSAFRREAIEEVSGFDPDTATEDFDVTIQLLKRGWKTRHSSAVVETSAPTTWSGLRRQRLRWNRGGAETTWKHRDAATDPQYGYLHSLVLPMQFVSRLLIPPVSYAVLVLVGFELLSNPSVRLLTLSAFFLLLTALVVGTVLLIDETDTRLLLYAPLLLVGYVHFLQYTVAAGVVQSVLNRNYDW